MGEKIGAFTYSLAMLGSGFVLGFSKGWYFKTILISYYTNNLYNLIKDN